VAQGQALSTAEKQALRTSEETREAMADRLVAETVARLPAEGIARAPNGRERNRLRELALELVATRSTAAVTTAMTRARSASTPK